MLRVAIIGIHLLRKEMTGGETGLHKSRLRQCSKVMLSRDGSLRCAGSRAVDGTTSHLEKKEAVRTFLLSKKWHHIGLNRPNLEFFEEWFDDTEEELVSVNCCIGSTLPNLNSSENLFNNTQET
ncbi:F-box family protein [Striga asiatica]|uniref:F-box family protein n=1 Tax=Striga asiatica TaxID=4170 RepID=A0A5A7RBL8_STRAF|nr:F-box family protein [Striga asiatica]